MYAVALVNNSYNTSVYSEISLAMLSNTRIPTQCYCEKLIQKFVKFKLGELTETSGVHYELPKGPALFPIQSALHKLAAQLSLLCSVTKEDTVDNPSC